MDPAAGHDKATRLMEKHSVRIAGHETSITLESEFWEALRRIAEIRNQPLHRIIEDIDNIRGERNLSSAIRVYVLKNITKHDA